MTQRARYNGSLRDLADAFSSTIKKSYTVQYGKTAESLKSEELVKYGPLIRSLSQLYPSLSFKRKDIRLALMKMARDKFGMDAKTQRSYGKAVTPRIALLCRHVSQQKHKNTPPGWYVRIMENKKSVREQLADTPGSEEPATEEPSAKKAALEKPSAKKIALEPPAKKIVLKEPPAEKGKDAFFFGWHSQSMEAWRCPIATPDSKFRVYTSVLKCGEGADEMDSPIAVWKDGMTEPVPELTVLAFRELKKGEMDKARSKAVYFYRGKLDDDRAVRVRERGDRGVLPLISMYVEGKQVCSVQQGDEVPHAVAVEVIVEVAKKLVMNEIKISECYHARDVLLVNRGVPTTASCFKQNGGRKAKVAVAAMAKKTVAASSSSKIGFRVRGKTNMKVIQQRFAKHFAKKSQAANKKESAKTKTDVDLHSAEQEIKVVGHVFKSGHCFGVLYFTRVGGNRLGHFQSHDWVGFGTPSLNLSSPCQNIVSNN